MKTFAIGIPTLNRYDLLKEALEKYVIDFPNTKIFIVDNGNQHINEFHSNISVIHAPRNLGVAASWNILCNAIFAFHTHAFILNDDIYSGQTEGEINDLINTNFDFHVGPFYWSEFIIYKSAFNRVGGFDEEFYPAYYEDNSFAYKLKLNHCSYNATNILTPKVQRNSMTLEKDPTINKTFEQLTKLYKEMWGGKPGEEKYITKFNKNTEW